MAIPSDLLFAVDSATLSPDAEVALNNLVGNKIDRVLSIKIDAHTDGDASEAYNQILSNKRSQAVSEWFTDHRVPRDVITATGWGETKPVVPNDTPDHKRVNRRVEITVRFGR